MNYFEFSCTVDTALPDGSFRLSKLLSHLRAISELQATDGFEGTVKAELLEGKNSLNIFL